MHVYPLSPLDWVMGSLEYRRRDRVRSFEASVHTLSLSQLYTLLCVTQRYLTRGLSLEQLYLLFCYAVDFVTHDLIYYQCLAVCHKGMNVFIL